MLPPERFYTTKTLSGHAEGCDQGNFSPARSNPHKAPLDASHG